MSVQSRIGYAFAALAGCTGAKSIEYGRMFVSTNRIAFG